MNADQVEAFRRLTEDDAFRNSFLAAPTPEDKREMLDEAGLEIGVADAEAVLAGEGELTDEELDQAAGADIGIIRYPAP
jgi:predicted ribosomally synthesized peptide with nif11-like leader